MTRSLILPGRIAKSAAWCTPLIAAANWLRVMVRTIWYVANVLRSVKLVARAALSAAAAGGLRGYSPGGAAARMMNKDEILKS